MDYYWSIVGSDIRRGSESSPVAISSIFGYLVSGEETINSAQRQQQEQVTPALFTTSQVDRSPGLGETVERFWALESLDISEYDQLPNDDLATGLFSESITYTGERHRVGLPWRPGHPPLINNFNSACQRYQRLQAKLKLDSPLHTSYQSAMQEFIDEGYVELAPSITVPNRAIFYMPHRPVLKQGSSTYKTRPVFDASAKDPEGTSLNDCLLIGPSLVPQLLYIIISFRSHSVGLIGDIRRAFLQIEVHEKDRDVLRFIWMDKIWRFTRVPFGVNSSPFLLNATIRHHLANRQPSSEYEESVIANLDEHLYVDDFVTGASDVAETTRKCLTSHEILEEAGMSLRCWNSNSRDVLSQLESHGLETDCETVLQVLGLVWDTTQDSLSIKAVSWKKDDTINKRNILSFIAQVFDVFGFLSPLTVRGKILLQQLWKLKLAWDQEIVDQAIVDEAKIIVGELSAAHELKVPRWFCVDPDSPFILHLVCDASPYAYACAVYASTSTTSHLIASKNRVAPIKTPKTIPTIPRLELLRCLIGAKLLSGILELTFAKNCTTQAWSDSKIALAWIQQEESNFRQVFVSNQVNKIKRLLPNITWRYIPTSDNPADLATRSNQTVESIKMNNWFCGPDFFKLPPDQWPSSAPSADDEVSHSFTGLSRQTTGSEPPIREALFDLNRRSRLILALRTTAYSLRFVNRLRRIKDQERDMGPTAGRILETTCGVSVHVSSTDELENARRYWIRFYQETFYPEEMSALRQSVAISTSSPIWDLGPVMDDKGLMRSVGRVARTPSANSPILLPAKSPFTRLLILHTHETVFHTATGVTGTQTEIRRQYWIVKGRLTVKNTLAHCGIYKRHKVLPYLLIPSALPEWRVTELAPFLSVGMDFAGPFSMKDGELADVLLITCCSVRALHCEVTSDMSTRSVLNAFRRFKTRRGPCDFVVSDNGKYFLKAQRELSGEVKWITIPERSPWWGGFWERLVRSVKTALKRGIGRASLTFEEFRTIIPEIKAAINRRPITYVSDDRDDPQPLRLVDFLLAPGPPPQTEAANARQRLVGRWRHQLSVYKNTVSRWETEYLAEIHRWTTKPTGGKSVPRA